MDITTHTIAELYIKQGYPDKAMDIYKAIVELDPANEEAKQKIIELEAQMSMAEESVVPVESSAEEISVAEDGENDVESQICRLETWLSEIREIRGAA